MDALSQLENRDEPYMILSSSELTYVRTLWTEDGYVLEYQEGNVDRHFASQELLRLREIEEVFLQYLSGDETWKDRHDFAKKAISDPYEQAGRVAGRLFGRIAAKGTEFAREFKKAFDEGKK